MEQQTTLTPVCYQLEVVSEFYCSLLRHIVHLHETIAFYEMQLFGAPGQQDEEQTATPVGQPRTAAPVAAKNELTWAKR
jgi:hypothetical protein